MNYINRLEAEVDRLKSQIAQARLLVESVETYLLSPKFQGVDNDYVYVRTDILPKLSHIKTELLGD